MRYSAGAPAVGLAKFDLREARMRLAVLSGVLLHPLVERYELGAYFSYIALQLE